MALVVEHPYNKYGSTILIRDDLNVLHSHSVNKQLSNNPFELPALGYRDLSHIVLGNVNSKCTSKDHDTRDDNIHRWNSGQTHATSHPYMMLSHGNHLTVHDRRK